MPQLPYDIKSAEAIFVYSQKLTNKTLGSITNSYSAADNPINKGRLGSMVEEHFFQYKPGGNKDHVPDFSEAGLELKVTGVLKNSKATGSPYRAKERLVLTMISYFGIVEETWQTCSLMKKCKLMLILFYLYQKDIPASDLRFVMEPLLWKFPDADYEIIKKDWEAIQKKIFEGKAHELSEGDTFYLGACRKGAGGTKESLRKQPFSSELAKARAFALKQSYVNTIISSHAKETGLLNTNDDIKNGIEYTTLDKFKNLYNLSVEEISKIYDFKIKEKAAKNYLADLSLRILGTKKRNIPEFEKADIVLKTIRLSASGMPKEAISFPTFDFIDMVSSNWEDSVFYEKINKKIFFVVYQYDKNNVLRFKKAIFWNMPYADREEARIVWERTVEIIKQGDMSHLPKSSDSNVAHVRPHGKNKADTLPLPNGGEFTKQCFWLNAKYIAGQLSK